MDEDEAGEKFASRPERIWRWLCGGGEPTYWLTRAVFLRALGFVYVVAFLVLLDQGIALVGEDGLWPARAYLRRAGDGFWDAPSLLWWGASDGVIRALGWLGLGLALAMLGGWGNAAVAFGLWAVYQSVVNAGAVFYGYGWEMQLLETGFLAIFLAPPLLSDVRSTSPPPTPVIWLVRWLLFRVMFGAGLIKLRGDACWEDLTCLEYHFETQPIPNPVSWYLHHLPDWLLHAGVLVNHVAELIAPWLIFGPRRVRYVGGAIIAGFQGFLIVSGNLSFLNWLTLIACIACFDDRFFEWLLPATVVERFDELADRAHSPSRPRRVVVWGVFGLVVVLSAGPVRNMLSPDQAMNRAFNQFHLVNTYGAFGSVTRKRWEIVLQGTRDREIDEETEWKPYVFPCKPTRRDRQPCLVTPYHYRLDWQMWFAAMARSPREQPWFLKLVYDLLHGDPQAERLFHRVPFDEPPRHIRAVRYVYRFTDRRDTDQWWRRERLGVYLPPVSRDSKALETYLERIGFVGE